MDVQQLLLTRRQVESLTGLSRSAIYKYMDEGLFPRPVKIASYAVRWRRDEVLGWVESRPRSTGAAA